MEYNQSSKNSEQSTLLKIVYQNSDILRLKDDNMSYVKPLPIVRISRRKILKIEIKSMSPKHFQLKRPGYDQTLISKARAHSKVLAIRASTENIGAKIMSLLNRLAPSNRVKLQDQILEISLKSEENLKLVVEKIFQKVCLEKKYSSLWAELCTFLVEKFKNPSLNEKNRFKSELLTKSQKLFETFDLNEDYSLIHKKRMMGNLIFVAELFKIRVIPKKTICFCLESLLGEGVNEDRIEGAAILILNCGKACLSLGSQFQSFIDRFNEMITKQTVSSRIRFLLMVKAI